MPTKLEEIIAATRERVAVAKASADLRALGEAAERHQPRGFRDGLRRGAESWYCGDRGVEEGVAVERIDSRGLSTWPNWLSNWKTPEPQPSRC